MNMKRKEAAVFAVAAALAAGFKPAGACEDSGGALETLREAAGEVKVEAPAVGRAEAEIVLEPARPAKNRLIPGELERLRSVAAEIFKNTPKGEKSFGTFNVHRLSLKGDYQDDGGLKLKSVHMTREFHLSDPYSTDKKNFIFRILPDGRIDDHVMVQEHDAAGGFEWHMEPLKENDVQDVLRGELEFWLWGDGWRETTHIVLKPSRRHH